MGQYGYLSVPVVLLVILILTDSSSYASSMAPPAASMPEKALQWYEAYLSCRSRQQTLLTPPPFLSAALLTQWLPSDGTRVWLGGRFVHTAWRWADGCGVERMEGCVSVSHLPLPRGHFASEDPFDCLIQCGTPFVALQGKECQCLRSEPRRRVKVTRCDLRCANNLDQFCGGLHRYASIYSMQPSSVKWDSGREKVKGDCAFLHLPTQSSVGLPDVRIRTDACNERITGGYKRHLCEKCSPRNDQCEVTRHRGYVTWLDASADCRKEGGQLLNVRTNRSLPLLFHPYISEDYWIGLKRDFVLKWINGSVVIGDQLTSPVVKEGGFCLTASRGDNTSHITFTAVDCALKLPFFCAPDPHRKPVIPQDLNQSEFCRSPLFLPHTLPSSLPPNHHLPSFSQQPLTTPGSGSSTTVWNISQTSRVPPTFQDSKTTMHSVSTLQYKASSQPLTGHMKTNGVQVSYTSKQPAAHTTFDASSVSATLRATSSLKSSRFSYLFTTFRTTPYMVTSKTPLLLLTSHVSSLQTTSRIPLPKVSSHTPKVDFSTKAVARTSTDLPTEHVELHTTERSYVSSTLKKNHKLQSKTSQNPKILTTSPKSERPTTLTILKSPMPPLRSSTPKGTVDPKKGVTVSGDSTLLHTLGSSSTVRSSSAVLTSQRTLVSMSTSPEHTVTRTFPSDSERPTSFSVGTPSTPHHQTDMSFPELSNDITSVTPSDLHSSSLSSDHTESSYRPSVTYYSSSATNTEQGRLSTAAGHGETMSSSYTKSSVSMPDFETSPTHVITQYLSTNFKPLKNSSPKLGDVHGVSSPDSKSTSPGQQISFTSPDVHFTSSSELPLSTGSTNVMKGTHQTAHGLPTSRTSIRPEKSSSGISGQTFSTSPMTKIEFPHGITLIYSSSLGSTTNSQPKSTSEVILLSSPETNTQSTIKKLSLSPMTTDSASRLTTMSSQFLTSLSTAGSSVKDSGTLPSSAGSLPTSVIPTTTVTPRTQSSMQTRFSDSVSTQNPHAISTVTDSHYPSSTSDTHKKLTTTESQSKLPITVSQPVSGVKSNTQTYSSLSESTTNAYGIRQTSDIPVVKVGNVSKTDQSPATGIGKHNTTPNPSSQVFFTTPENQFPSSTSSMHFPKNTDTLESRSSVTRARIDSTVSSTAAIYSQHGGKTNPYGRQTRKSTSPITTRYFHTTVKHYNNSVSDPTTLPRTTMASTRMEDTKRTTSIPDASRREEGTSGGHTRFISKTSVTSTSMAGVTNTARMLGTSPVGRTTKAHTTLSVAESTLPPTHTEGVTPTDLLPLYLVMGLLAGMIVVVAAVVCGVIKHRIQNVTRIRWIRMKESEDDFTGRDNFSTWSAATSRTRYSIEADPQFRFVERSEC